MWLKRISQVCLFAMVFALTGCINLTTANKAPLKTYTFSVDTKHVPRGASTQKTLQMNIAQAAMGLRTQKMAYQLQSPQISYFANHSWLAPPASLVIPVLAQALTASQHFKAVVMAPTYGGETDYQLSLTLFTLQQNFASENKSEEELRLELIVIDTLKNKPLAAKMFTMTVPAEPNPEGGVAAANQALATLLPDMVQFVIMATQ